MQTLHKQEPTVTALPCWEGTQQGLPPAQEQVTLRKTSKIVSKRRYVANVGKKTALSAVVFGFLIVGILTGLGTLGSLSSLLVEYDKSTIFLIVAFASATLACHVFAWHTLSKANSFQTGIPLTRANTADLPAPDMLVRASSEPLQAQKDVLLRAAAEGQEKHEVQLVRAAGADYLMTTPEQQLSHHLRPMWPRHWSRPRHRYHADHPLNSSHQSLYA